MSIEEATATKMNFRTSVSKMVGAVENLATKAYVKVDTAIDRTKEAASDLVLEQSVKAYLAADRTEDKAIAFAKETNDKVHHAVDETKVATNKFIEEHPKLAEAKESAENNLEKAKTFIREHPEEVVGGAYATCAILNAISGGMDGNWGRINGSITTLAAQGLMVYSKHHKKNRQDESDSPDGQEVHGLGKVKEKLKKVDPVLLSVTISAISGAAYFTGGVDDIAESLSEAGKGLKSLNGVPETGKGFLKFSAYTARALFTETPEYQKDHTLKEKLTFKNATIDPVAFAKNSAQYIRENPKEFGSKMLACGGEATLLTGLLGKGVLGIDLPGTISGLLSIVAGKATRYVSKDSEIEKKTEIPDDVKKATMAAMGGGFKGISLSPAPDTPINNDPERGKSWTEMVDSKNQDHKAKITEKT